MEHERTQEYQTSQQQRQQQQHHHQPTVACDMITCNDSTWSDDDCGIVNENDDDNSDNTWLVSTSISSTSSEHSIDSDDDENDVESIPSEAEICSNKRLFDGIPDIGHHHHNQHLQQHHPLFSTTNQHCDANNADANNTIRQIPQQSRGFFSNAKTRIHNYLSSYSEFVTKAKHQEILLKLLQWSLWLVGACLIQPSPSNNGLLPQWIQKLSYDICYARYVTRLLGLPVAIEGAMSGSWATSCSVQENPSLDAIYRFIGMILAYSMVVYYPVEHVAFFLWMNPNAESVLNLSAATWFYISMRCWLVYLIAEMIQCVIKYNELYQFQRATQHLKKTDIHEKTTSRRNHAHLPVKSSLWQQLQRGIASYNNITVTPCNSNEHKSYDMGCRSESKDRVKSDIGMYYDITPKELNDEMYNVMLLFVRNLFYIAPCTNWSMSNWDTDPLLSDIALNGLMWMEAVICLYQAIYNNDNATE